MWPLPEQNLLLALVHCHSVLVNVIGQTICFLILPPTQSWASSSTNAMVLLFHSISIIPIKLRHRNTILTCPTLNWASSRIAFLVLLGIPSSAWHKITPCVKALASV